MRERYDFIYRDLRLKSGRKVLIRPLLFLLRRIYFAYLLVASKQTFYWEMQQVILMSIVTFIAEYALEASQSPSERRWVNFHEYVILMTCYAIFSLNLVDEKKNFTIGYVTIAIILSYMTFCILVEILTSLLGLKLKVRIFCVKRRFKKARKKL